MPRDVSIFWPLADRLTSRSTASIAWMERDNWPASTFAMLPDSETAALIESVLSSQIVHPTALPKIQRSNIAAHQRCRRGMVRVTAPAVPDVSAGFLFRLGVVTDIAGHQDVNQVGDGP